MRSKLSTSILSVLLIVSLSSCYTARVGTHIQGDPVAADRVMRAHVRQGLEKELLAYRMKIDK